MRVHEAPEDPRIKLGPLNVDPRAIIYSTILMITAVAILDPEPGPLTPDSLLRGAAVLLGPLFAIAMAHGFSEAIDMQIRLRRRLTWADRRHLFVVNMQYLFMGVVGWVSVLISFLVGASVTEAMTQLYVLALASLVGWGVAAAHHAGLPWQRQIIMGLNYGVLGFLIVLLELWLRH